MECQRFLQYSLFTLFFPEFFLLIHLNIQQFVTMNVCTDAWCPLSVPFLKYILSESCGQKISRPKNHLKHFTWHLSLSCRNLAFVLYFFASVFHYALNKRKSFPFLFDSTPSRVAFPSLIACAALCQQHLPRPWLEQRQTAWGFGAFST